MNIQFNVTLYFIIIYLLLDLDTYIHTKTIIDKYLSIKIIIVIRRLILFLLNISLDKNITIFDIFLIYILT